MVRCVVLRVVLHQIEKILGRRPIEEPDPDDEDAVRAVLLHSLVHCAVFVLISVRPNRPHRLEAWMLCSQNLVGTAGAGGVVFSNFIGLTWGVGAVTQAEHRRILYISGAFCWCVLLVWPLPVFIHCFPNGQLFVSHAMPEQYF